MARRFSEEYKRRAVELLCRSGNASAIAEELGIGLSTLCKWKRKYCDEVNPIILTDAEQIKSLKKENARLREELTILKKATAFFARETLQKR